MLKIIQKYQSLFKFGLVGLTNTFIDFTIFSILIFFHTDKLIAQICGYTFGIINSFILNKIWTFEADNGRAFSQLVKFLPVNLMSLGTTLIGLEILVHHFEANIFFSKIVVTIFAQAINYFGYKLWVFASKPKIQHGKGEHYEHKN